MSNQNGSKMQLRYFLNSNFIVKIIVLLINVEKRWQIITNTFNDSLKMTEILLLVFYIEHIVRVYDIFKMEARRRKYLFLFYHVKPNIFI